eukprot:CAMPEP_0194743484 /NCGR_PEP_ID=MMETSP0296-20130528/100336_1 /TAXON_ID=39354 /ORGANISM="Heterosigma akashiwo, Strain CCMP2393" /LENGTH=310 /DNA_ID=CAMNT_0039655515 /DNA_START=67 /DNA_END=999 /DNA_ORIENTATION=+
MSRLGHSGREIFIAATSGGNLDEALSRASSQDDRERREIPMLQVPDRGTPVSNRKDVVHLGRNGGDSYENATYGGAGGQSISSMGIFGPAPGANRRRTEAEGKSNNASAARVSGPYENATYGGAGGQSIASMGIFGPAPGANRRRTEAEGKSNNASAARVSGPYENATYGGAGGQSIASMGIFGPAPGANRRRIEAEGKSKASAAQVSRPYENATYGGAGGKSIASMGIFGPAPGANRRREAEGKSKASAALGNQYPDDPVTSIQIQPHGSRSYDNPTYGGPGGQSIASMGIFGPAPGTRRSKASDHHME